MIFYKFFSPAPFFRLLLQATYIPAAGGIKGAAICIPAAPGCAAHRPGKRDAPASGTWARSASKVPRGGRVPAPALQSSGPAACLKRDEAKAVMAAWVSWADHLATRAPTTRGRSRAGASSARARAKDRMKEAASSLHRPPTSTVKHDQPASVRPHELWVGPLFATARHSARAAPATRPPRRTGWPWPDTGETTAGCWPPHSGRPLATTSSRLSSTRST